MENIQRPIILEIEEAKVELVQVINNAIQTRKLPFYMVEMIVADLHLQLKEGAKSELENAQKIAAQQEAERQQTEIPEVEAEEGTV